MNKAELFYINYVFIASLHQKCIQGAFDSLMGLLNWLGLSTHLVKTKVMIFHPVHIVVTQ